MISLIFLGACGKTYETEDIIKGFKSDGLKVSDEKKMSRDDYGGAPMKAEEAKIFAVDQNKHARIMKFKNSGDLAEAKKFYDEVGKESAILYSHTYSKDHFLIQMSGDIEYGTFVKYKRSMNKTLR